MSATLTLIARVKTKCGYEEELLGFGNKTSPSNSSFKGLFSELASYLEINPLVELESVKFVQAAISISDVSDYEIISENEIGAIDGTMFKDSGDQFTLSKVAQYVDDGSATVTQ
jgi:hypothetical protein